MQKRQKIKITFKEGKCQQKQGPGLMQVTTKQKVQRPQIEHHGNISW